MSVEFGDGSEPWSVARGNARRWMHCLVRQVEELPDDQRDELCAWLAERGAELGPSLLVSRGEDGYRVRVAGASLAVDVEDLPVWLQRPQPQAAQPQPAPVKATRARK